MENYTDFAGTQQSHEEWTSFSQNLSVLPHQPTFDSECLFLPEQPVAQQNVTYDSNLNGHLLSHNTTGQINANYLPLDDAEPSSRQEVRQNLALYPQHSSSFYTAFDMSTASSVLDNPVESADLGGAEVPLKSQFPDCSQYPNFLTGPALQANEAKHSKSYVCQMPDCKHTHFGDKGGLVRHRREVHGSKTHYCPMTLCKRHTKGFARKYNLFEHQKRCHPGQSPNTTLALIQRSQNDASFNREGTEGGRCSNGEASSPEIMIIGDLASTSGGRLREELERLCTLRVELDSDIAALKRALDILGELSP